MKINDEEFFFDRCLKFVFTGPNLTKTDENGQITNAPLTIEYCPRKDERLCPHLEADIKDMPSPNEKDRPGYSGVLKIYNPGQEIIQMVAKSVTWFYEFTNKNNGEPASSKSSDASVRRYYANKMRVKVYAGYYDESIKDGDYGNAPILDGYVNNTYYFRQGTDDVLTIYCHDVDMSQASAKANSYGELFAKTDSAIDSYIEQMDERRRGKATFDSTFKNLVDNFQHGLPLPRSGYPKYRVLYVWSPQDYYYNIKQNPGTGSAVEDPKLAAVCRDTKITSGFYTNAERIETMLNELCNYAALNLDWELDLRYATIPTYIVYRKEEAVKIAKLKDKGIVTIINFQNLMEQPVIDGTGSLTMKMFFNRRCAPWAYIQLVFTGADKLGEGVAKLQNTGLLTIDNKLIGGFAGQAQNPAIATTQLSGSTGVAAVLNNQARGLAYGYLYNNPFLIVTTNHKLNTHGNDWVTLIKTTPLIRGKLATENTR